MVVNYAVAIAAILRLVVFSERQESVFPNARRWLRLRRELAKQLPTIIDCTVIIAVEREPGIIAASRGPRQMLSRPISVQIKGHSTL